MRPARERSQALAPQVEEALAVLAVEVIEERVGAHGAPVLLVEAAHLHAHGDDLLAETGHALPGRAQLEEQPAGERGLSRAGRAEQEEPAACEQLVDGPCALEEAFE